MADLQQVDDANNSMRGKDFFTPNINQSDLSMDARSAPYVGGLPIHSSLGEEHKITQDIRQTALSLTK